MNNVSISAIRKFLKKPAVTRSINHSKITLDFYDNNLVMFRLNGKMMDWFHAYAKTDTSSIDTRTAQRKSIRTETIDGTCHIEAVYVSKDLTLKQYFEIEKDRNYFLTYIKISGSRTIRSNELVPMDFVYPHVESEELFLSLEEKMICVPYDNDMWVHYDSLPLRPGRTSYDVTAIYDDRNMKGMIIGALDFDTWKNAIVCSAYDARSFRAVSGIADAQTHDHLPHGYLEGKEITSSHFICGFYDDVRDGLEEYGRLCINGNGVYHWDHGVPFGWNSYSALTLMTRLKDVETAGDFIHEDLENFRSEDGATYINFDSVIN
ncbi:MAG: hypothetical protein J5796_00640, partial [Erysipelotrichaceae bacterium]|nr:hypothetical protein [Erysipelotrichaceae bacterium]